MKKKDKIRFDKLRQIGCIACLKIGKVSDAIVHHIRKHTGLSVRPSHDDTIPLCPNHHNMGNNSIHLNKSGFESLFGSEKQLLDETNFKIKQLEEEQLFYDGKGSY